MALDSKQPVHSVMDDVERPRTRHGTLHAINTEDAGWNPAARLDLYAVGLSTLCLLHCLALPVLAALMPVAAQASESELVHRVIAIAAVPVSLRVIWKTWPVKGNRLFISAALVGLGLLLLAAFVETVSLYEASITAAGAVLLGSAHLWHWSQKLSGCSGPQIKADEP